MRPWSVSDTGGSPLYKMADCSGIAVPPWDFPSAFRNATIDLSLSHFRMVSPALPPACPRTFNSSDKSLMNHSAPFSSAKPLLPIARACFSPVASLIATNNGFYCAFSSLSLM